MIILAPGKLVTVDPVPGVSSKELRRLLLSILYQQHKVGQATARAAASQDGKVKGVTTTSAGAAVSAAVKMLHLIIEARHVLRPMTQGGNAGCGDRCG